MRGLNWTHIVEYQLKSWVSTPNRMYVSTLVLEISQILNWYTPLSSLGISQSTKYRTPWTWSNKPKSYPSKWANKCLLCIPNGESFVPQLSSLLTDTTTIFSTITKTWVSMYKENIQSCPSHRQKPIGTMKKDQEMVKQTTWCLLSTNRMKIWVNKIIKLIVSSMSK